MDRRSIQVVIPARNKGAGIAATLKSVAAGKKAGPLNQALARVLPDMDDDDIILVADADSAIAPKLFRHRRRGDGQAGDGRGVKCRARDAEAFTSSKSAVVPAAFARGNEQEKDLS